MTVRECLKYIPKGWRDVELTIGNTIGRPQPIKRISLHQDFNGRRVIIIHENTVKENGNG